MFNDLDKNEEFDTTYSLIGIPKITYEGGSIEEVLYDYDEIEQKLHKSILSYDTMSKSEAKSIIIERRKQAILRLLCCEVDGHIENEGIIRYVDENGNPKVRLAPTFDNETCFMLNSENDTIEAYVKSNEDYSLLSSILKDVLLQIKKGTNISEYLDKSPISSSMIEMLKETNPSTQKLAEILSGAPELRDNVDKLFPRIVFRPDEEEQEDYPYKNDFDNTLARLRDFSDSNEELNDFIYDLNSNLNISNAIKSVESKIKTPIPENIKFLVTAFFNMRKKTLNNILDYEMPCEQYLDDATLLQEQLISKQAKQSIGEQYSTDILKRTLSEQIPLEFGFEAIENSILDIQPKDEEKEEKNELT